MSIDSVEIIQRKRLYGWWINTGLNGDVEGYRCDGPITRVKPCWFLPSVGVYDFHLNPERGRALTWIMGEKAAAYMGVPIGTEMQPDGEFLTDRGSIPSIIHWLMERDRLLGFYPHDSQYQTHRMWIRHPGGLWQRLPITRAQSDMCLYFSGMADPIPPKRWECELVWRGVAAFGRFGWDR